MPVRLGAASQQSIRLGAAQVTRMYLGVSQVYSSAPAEPPAPRPDMPAPSNLTAVAANATVVLNWTNGVTATSHVIQQSTDGGASWVEATAAVSGLSTATVTGLTNGFSYRFRVAAQTALGLTSFSAASEAVRPIGPPGIPESLAINSGSLTWRAPTDAGGSVATEIRYIIQRGTGSSGSQVWTVHETLTGVTQYALTGSCSTSYWWRIAANTAGGQSAYSSAIQQSAAGSGSIQPPKWIADGWVRLEEARNGLAVTWINVAEQASDACDSPSHYEVWYRKQIPNANDNLCGDLSGMSLGATVPVQLNVSFLHAYHHDLTGLDPAAAYFVAVRAVNAAGAASHVCCPYTLRPGGATVPLRPSGIFSTSYGSGHQVWVPAASSVSGEVLETELMHGTFPPLFSVDPSTGLPWTSGQCPDGVSCADTQFLSGRAPTDGFSTCKVGPYYQFTWASSGPADPRQSVSSGRYRCRVRGIDGTRGPWAYVEVSGIFCASVPTPDPPQQAEFLYVRGGRQNVRIQRTTTSRSSSPCMQGLIQQQPDTWWVEHRGAGISTDSGTLFAGSSASNEWIPLLGGSNALGDVNDGFSIGPVSSGLFDNSVSEIRIRGENDWGMGAYSSPVHVRTHATGGTPASALNATGSMLYDVPSAWTQPVLAAPSTHMSAGRYFTVSRDCLVSLSVSLGTTNSGASPASASILVADGSGAPIGFIAHKTRSNATVRLCFYAKPNRRYSVEVTDTASATSSVTNCYSEDIYDTQRLAVFLQQCHPYQRLRAKVPVLLTAASRFGFAAGKDGSAAEWLGPVVMQRSFDGEENNHWIRAETKCRVYYKVTGQWEVFLGSETQRRRYSLWAGSSAQSTSGGAHIELETGQYLTIAPSASTAQTGTLNYVYAELRPNLAWQLAGSEFNSLDAMGGESGMLASEKNGL